MAINTPNLKQRRAGILIFDDVEVLDFSGPFEVFSVTRIDEQQRSVEASPFEVLLVAESMLPVTTAGGMRVMPHTDFEHCPPLDILVLTGGMGTRIELNNETLLAFVKRQWHKVDTLASVCTGALILGNTGLLNGLEATTHWKSLDLMQKCYPEVRVDRNSHVVDTGKIITSAGISAGIDMALTVVRRYFGETIARATARHMEYPYPESNARRS
ncbi:AraC family transcriptional regulator [Acidihalobacter yilgarnensis]|uniref:AraC family transcriptional regulator n=1 Tax=Acidihalobacter yilgarnensis TaxID=2819280 RepID=A0A1D8IS34_9GAMM|nr:DJ-1/PfpI family protein [Acidihalobacter yilgarnensis]AOU99320.1 AraC family transcriptional regulator [Acidihalobacter yilgarnensis]